jgi:nitrite reductase/ring-hydroxylating ferredoxin subunit
MPDIAVGPLSELPPGERKFFAYKSSEVAVFNLDGKLIAVRSHCPHHGAPICRGLVGGTIVGDDPARLEYQKQGKVLACPWHHWQFDLESGACLTNPRQRLKRYPVSVHDGEVIVHV